MSPRSRYVVGPAYDWAFFLLPPLASLAVGIDISFTPFSERTFEWAGRELTGARLLVGTLTHAHLVAVLVRSHGNDAIRPLHPIRFLVVPVLLWGAIMATPWIAVTATVVATFWDVWHSGAQTFGFARIYDRNLGNDPRAGRRLDFWLNQLLYAGPILGGVTLIDHLRDLDGYEQLGATLFSGFPPWLAARQRLLARALLAVGTLCVAAYLAAYVRLWRRGYRVSFHKVFLIASTAACSIYTWGLNRWGEAYFIMNLFHAVQYLALVWATEREHLVRRLRLGKAFALLAYLAAVLAYGLGAELVEIDLPALWAITLVVSLMHFWYDGFIWSVARRQV